MSAEELYAKGEKGMYWFYETLCCYLMVNIEHHSWLPSCRIQINLQGFEWSLYNRTAAYESILVQMEESLGRNVSRSTDRNRSSQRLSSLSECRQFLQLVRLTQWSMQNQGDNQRRDVSSVFHQQYNNFWHGLSNKCRY